MIEERAIVDNSSFMEKRWLRDYVTAKVCSLLYCFSEPDSPKIAPECFWSSRPTENLARLFHARNTRTNAHNDETFYQLCTDSPSSPYFPEGTIAGPPPDKQHTLWVWLHYWGASDYTIWCLGIVLYCLASRCFYVWDSFVCSYNYLAFQWENSVVELFVTSCGSEWSGELLFRPVVTDWVAIPGFADKSFLISKTNNFPTWLWLDALRCYTACQHLLLVSNQKFLA